MRVSGRLLVAASTLLVSLSATTAAQDRPEDLYLSCYTGAETSPMYFSAVWEEKAVYADVSMAWKKFLADKYDFKGQVYCAGAQKRPGVDLAKARADQLSMREHWQKQGKTIVETGWTTLMPAAKPAVQNPPGSGAAPAAAAGPNYWSACQLQRSTNTGYTTYFSDVFPSGLKTTDGIAYQNHHALLVKAYGEFVSSKYGRERDNPQCNIMASEEKMRAVYKTWIDQASKDGKTIMTGWKYAPQ